MSLILSIETSTKVCSVALHENGELVALSELYKEKSHSGLLSVLIKQVLEQTSHSMQDLSAVAVSMGPGSYTGLRIGVSTAKGICYGLNIPLISVNTLLAMAYGVMSYNIKESLVCPMIDARRMEVYCLVANPELNLVQNTQAKIIDENSFDDLLKENQLIFLGDGSEKCKAVLGANSNALFIDNVTPSATNIGALATKYYSQEKFEDVAYFEPFYLKDFRVIQPKGKK
jgi:tRNA threonylcarbamoyladenosine biosynthesis protein TsaB